MSALRCRNASKLFLRANLLQSGQPILPCAGRKIIFKLTKEDGLKYREVAEILNISVKTVENQLAIALYKIGTAVSFDIRRTIPSSLKQHP